MLQVRIEGDEAEADAFITELVAAGIEVAVGTRKNRDGFHHIYTTMRMPGYRSAAAPPSTRLNRPTRPRRPTRRAG